MSQGKQVIGYRPVKRHSKTFLTTKQKLKTNTQKVTNDEDIEK